MITKEEGKRLPEAMAEDNDLEKRAIEELLRETDRARMRAETMGPTGWLKCPLQSTNKRFLLNTLRSTEPHKHSPETGDGAGAGAAAARGRSRSGSLDRQRDRSRSPLRDHTSKGGHGDHKHHQRDSWNNRDKRRAGDRERSSRRKDNREWRHGRDTRSKD